jgi:hypothetical protein
MGKMIAYKGFNKDLKCRNFQYEVGKAYELPNGEKPRVCAVGFHACENPFDVLDYYANVVNDRFCVVEQFGDFDKMLGKTASSRIRIKREIDFVGLFKAGIEWLKEATKNTILSTSDNDENGGCIGLKDNHVRIWSSRNYAKIGSSGDDAKIGSCGKYAQIGSSGDDAKIWSDGMYAQIGSSGDDAQIGSSGERALIASSGNSARVASSGKYAHVVLSGNSANIASIGDSSQITSSGDFAQVGSIGEDSIICCTGHNSMAKAKKGSWITLAEWEYSKEKDRLIPKCVKTEYVDGERIKADTWYKLVEGEFVEQ